MRTRWGRQRRTVLHVCTLPALADADGFGWALDDDDRRRAASFRHEEDRIRLAASRALLRIALAEMTGIAPTDQRFVRRCEVCGGPHGRPRLVPVGASPGDVDTARLTTPHASISHADRSILVGVHPTRPIGVDVESSAGTSFAGFDEVALTPEERDQLHTVPPRERPAARAAWWTRKEAVLKATGHGLAVDPTHLRVTPPGTPAALLDWTAPGVERPVVTLTDVDLPAPHSAAVAVLGAARVSVELRDVAAAALLRC